QTQDLSDYPFAAASTINFGLRDIAGLSVSSAMVAEYEREVRQAILDFEPRILPNSLRVRAVLESDRMARHTLSLAIEGDMCADPYAERLLVGFAFLAARVQLKVVTEFPRLTQHLLETFYPGYLAPIPSMAMVQFQPDPSEGSLAAGVAVPRGTALRSMLGRGEQTACEYRTAHDVTLWPLEIVEAEYFRYSGAAASLGVPSLPGVKAGLRIRIKTTGGLRFDQIAL